MDWVEDEVVLVEAEADRVPVLAVVRHEVLADRVQVDRVELQLAAVRHEAQVDRALEAAGAEVRAWDPTYRVIRRYPPRTEAWEPLVQVVAGARQQPWERRTRPVRTVRRKR